jgi:hypothetical protein
MTILNGSERSGVRAWTGFIWLKDMEPLVGCYEHIMNLQVP